jgi:phenylalanyl-tRNA synthetase alpha chain
MTEKDVESICQATLAEIGDAGTRDLLDRVRAKVLGRQGTLTLLFKQLGQVPDDQRRHMGLVLNSAKTRISDALKAQESRALSPSAGEGKPGLDVTLPGPRLRLGRRHPISQTIRRIRHTFESLGFEMASGPEMETERHNFDALNIPPEHPSRDGFDTFYLDDGGLLRSQTSTVQIRVMEKRKPPLRIIAPGRVYRPDRVDATHHYMFHQVEGLAVEDAVTFADMKYVLEAAVRDLFGEDRRMRLLPSFFPFTEPSAEVYMSCPFCSKGCSVCKQSGWIEIAGCGMVNPNVFAAVGYPEGRYTGFAFGMGLERIAMLLYGIPDIRLFTENDVGFLHQF